MPSSTYRVGAFLAAARALGVEVVIGSDRQQALAGAMGDNFLLVPLDDPLQAARSIAVRATRLALDAVIAIDDQSVAAAAHAAALLGLPRHNPPSAAEATRDKATMRSLLAASGVPQPRHLLVGTEPGDAMRAAATIGLPVVLKPVALSGSRGVIRLDSLDAAEDVAEQVRRIAADGGPILIEEYVDGPEVAVEGLLIGGILHVLAIFDKPAPLVGPYFEETVYVTPSRLEASILDRITAVTAEAAKALGLVEGPVHAELRLAEGGNDVRLIEVAARTIGGRCAKALTFQGGRTLEEIVLAHALGFDFAAGALELEEGASGVMMLPIPATGVLARVDGLDDAATVPGIAALEMTAVVGRVIRALPEGDRYLGFIFAAGPSPADVEAALADAYRRLRIIIEPVVPAAGGEPGTVTT